MITKMRASKISIEVPYENSEPWLHIEVQKVLKNDDGTIINVIPRADYISYPLSEFMTNVYTFGDPVLNEVHNNSGAGAASLISIIVVKMLLSEYGGYVTNDGDVII